jgi:hypothetical protein
MDDSAGVGQTWGDATPGAITEEILWLCQARFQSLRGGETMKKIKIRVLTKTELTKYCSPRAFPQ